jgi:pilus assembly protein Flp/PilA
MRNNRRGHWFHCQPMNDIRLFVADESAATAIEYCLIASGIALGIFVAVAGMEAKINAEFTAINSSLR